MNVKVPASFTLDQLMAHLRIETACGKPSSGFYTTRQWAKQFGIGVNRMRVLMSEAKESGALKMEMIRRERLDGKPCLVAAYAFDVDRLQAAMKASKKHGV